MLRARFGRLSILNQPVTQRLRRWHGSRYLSWHAAGAPRQPVRRPPMKATSAVVFAALSLACLATAAEARCKHEPMPVVLDAVVVTPNGAYTLAEWKQKQADKKRLDQTAIVFAPVIVTPKDE